MSMMNDDVSGLSIYVVKEISSLDMNGRNDVYFKDKINSQDVLLETVTSH